MSWDQPADRFSMNAHRVGQSILEILTHKKGNGACGKGCRKPRYAGGKHNQDLRLSPSVEDLALELEHL